MFGTMYRKLSSMATAHMVTAYASATNTVPLNAADVTEAATDAPLLPCQPLDRRVRHPKPQGTAFSVAYHAICTWCCLATFQSRRTARGVPRFDLNTSNIKPSPNGALKSCKRKIPQDSLQIILTATLGTTLEAAHAGRGSNCSSSSMHAWGLFKHGSSSLSWAVS
jgi:hypothetical protein